MKHSKALHFSRRSFLTAASLASALPTAAKANQVEAHSGEVKITRLDWAGVKIEFANSAVYIDAITPKSDNARVAAESDARFKYGFVTHGHGDHYDLAYLKTILGERGVIFVHKDSQISQHDLRVQHVREWEPCFVPRFASEMVVFAVPASDGFGDHQVSWVIEAAGRRIFHGGDTMWHGGMYNIPAAMGQFDVVCLPINGVVQNYGRSKNVAEQPISLNPEQAVGVAKLMGAKTLVPIHYGRSDPPVYIEASDQKNRVDRAAFEAGIAVNWLGDGETMRL